MKPKKPKLTNSKPSSRARLLPKRQLARALNKMLRRREAVTLKRPTRPLAQAVVKPESSVSREVFVFKPNPRVPVDPKGKAVTLVFVDDVHPNPYVVRWQEGRQKHSRECCDKTEADLVLTIHRAHQPELWVRAKQSL